MARLEQFSFKTSTVVFQVLGERQVTVNALFPSTIKLFQHVFIL